MSGSSALSPTPNVAQRPMSAMSQPTKAPAHLNTQPPQGSGSVSTSSGTYQLPPGAMPLPGMTAAAQAGSTGGSGSAAATADGSGHQLPQQYQQQQYPLTHSSPRGPQGMQQQDPYYWNQY